MIGPPVLCVGALTCDLMLHVPEIPSAPGKYLAKAARLVAAGMAMSAATAIARLGYPVALQASAGDDPIGDFLAAEIASEGIATDHVRRIPGAMSAVASITLDDRGERVVVPYYDPMLITPADTDPFASGSFACVLADVRWPAAAAAALDGAGTAGIPAILDLDVGPRDVLAALLPHASHVVASLDGAAILTGAGTAAEAVAALATITDAILVVTAGDAGLCWANPDGIVRSMPAFPVEVVDTNAAGDVFHGAFAVGLAEGMDMEAALRFASSAAAIKCTRYGGRIGAPTRAEVETFLASRAG